MMVDRKGRKALFLISIHVQISIQQVSAGLKVEHLHVGTIACIKVVIHPTYRRSISCPSYSKL